MSGQPLPLGAGMTSPATASNAQSPGYSSAPALLGPVLAPLVLLVALALPWLSRIHDPAEVLELLVVLVSCTAGLTMSCVDGCRPLMLIFSTFFLCWLGIGPLYQLSHGAMAWGDDALTHDAGAVRSALLLTDVFLVLFFLAAWYGSRPVADRARVARTRRPAVPAGWPALVLSLALLPYVIHSTGGVSQLFASRAVLDTTLAANGLSVDQSGGVALALADILPGAAAVAAGLMFICRLHYRVDGRRLRSDVVGLVIALALTGLYCNPLSNTRFVAVGAFGTLAVAWLRPTRRPAGVAFGIIGLFGTAFVYPLLSIFKTASGTGSASFTSGLKAFASPDFDGFQQIINTMSFTRTHGYGMGTHVLSALLYFVPRSIWQGKAQPASLEIAANRDYSFTNLSLPLHAEFYLDFGVLGVVALAIGLGLLWGRLDEHWVRSRMTPLQFTVVCYFSCAQLGFIRGPLGSLGPVYYTTTLLILASFAYPWATDRVRAHLGGREPTRG